MDAGIVSFITAIVCLVLMVAFSIYFQKRKVRKLINTFRKDWGKIKKDYRDFDLISVYHDLIREEKNNVVDEKTWNDLNFAHVFERIDATQSKPTVFIPHPKNAQNFFSRLRGFERSS